MSKSQEIIPHHVDKGAETPKFNEDFFSCKQGTAADFFPDSVRTTLNDYEANPQGYSAEEELIILSKMNLGLSFEQPGIADEDGAWIVADQLKRIARSKDFHFVSELGRRYAKYCDDADQLAFSRSLEDGDFQKMYSVGYSADRGGFGAVSSWGSDVKQYTYATAETDDHDQSRQQYISTLNSPAFQSFLAREFAYSTADFGKEFPIGLFVKFMEQQDPNTYEVSVRRMRELPETIRPAVAEAFLATEFGDDFGDAILDIAEHAERHQAMHIFETVNTLRVRTGEFAEMFKAIDPKFAHATEKAFNERITDALTALQEVAVKGHLHQDVAPYQKKADYVHDGRFDIAVHSIEEATEIIDGLEKTFGTMHKITTAEDLKITKVNSDETQFVIYRLASQSAGNMLIYVRPEGAYVHDKQMEYGNRQGVEASISFMVDPLNPRKLLLPKDPDAVSIRFDHEGRLVDEAPNSERRDPTRRDGLISADLSSGMGRASSLAVKIGRFVAAGNRIRANRRGTEDSLHHNTNYFDQEKYGDADGFAHLARSVIRQIELMKKILRSKKIGMAAHVTTKTTGSEQVDLPKAA